MVYLNLFQSSQRCDNNRLLYWSLVPIQCTLLVLFVSTKTLPLSKEVSTLLRLMQMYYRHKSNRIHNLHIHLHIRNLNFSPPTVIFEFPPMLFQNARMDWTIIIIYDKSAVCLQIQKNISYIWSYILLNKTRCNKKIDILLIYM